MCVCVCVCVCVRLCLLQTEIILLPPFNSFSCFIVLALTYSTFLHKDGKSGLYTTVPDLKGKAFNFSPLNMMSTLGFFYVAFIMLRQIPFMSDMLRVFNNKRCILSNAFYASIKMII